MSLKAYIRDRKSPIAEFLRSQFPNDRSFLADARKQVRQAATIRPVADVRWDIIGMAFDYRLRYYFAVTPYEELVAYKGARLFTEAQSECLCWAIWPTIGQGGELIRLRYLIRIPVK